MATGKANKKGGKKAKGNKKIVDAFAKKEWYDVKAPSNFEIKDVGKTVVSKTQGLVLSKDSLMGRVFTVSLGDLKKDKKEKAYRKFKLRVEDVQGQFCLTNFYGMDFTRDRLASLVKKWQTLIEATVDVRTLDDYVLRVTVIGFTNSRAFSNRKTSYAQSGQIRRIRKDMVDIIREEAKCNLQDFVKKLQMETIRGEIEKRCERIYPLHNVFVRKVKMVRTPKHDQAKLLELHGGAKGLKEMGKALEREQAAVKAAEEGAATSGEGEGEGEAAAEPAATAEA